MQKGNMPSIVKLLDSLHESFPGSLWPRYAVARIHTPRPKDHFSTKPYLMSTERGRELPQKQTTDREQT